MCEENNSAAETADNSASKQREGVMQQIAGVQARLESKGIGAAFYRAARPDPVGDMGFLGSLAFHAIMGGAFGGLMGASLPVGHGELDSALTFGTLEADSASSETQNEERQFGKRPKCSFYPLGRNNKKIAMIDKRDKRTTRSTSRFCPEVQSELAYMFQLMDTLGKLEVQEADEASHKRLHLVVRKPSNPAYQGVERRRRPRPEGLFNA